jgi:hypothetical protein
MLTAEVRRAKIKRVKRVLNRRDERRERSRK